LEMNNLIGDSKLEPLVATLKKELVQLIGEAVAI
jgi:hypothetical protein